MHITGLAEKISVIHKLDKMTARKIIDSAIKTIVETAAGGGETSLVGFGKFKVKHNPARTGRHPRTGEAIIINRAVR